jgi:hypothetical protein
MYLVGRALRKLMRLTAYVVFGPEFAVAWWRSAAVLQIHRRKLPPEAKDRLELILPT